MIGAAMLYGCVLSALVLMTALAVERFLHGHGGQTRRVWLAALVGTIAVPAGAVVLKDAPPAFELGGEVVATSTTSAAVMEGVATLASADTVLSTAWFLASLGLLVYFAGGFAVTLWESRRWCRRTIDGVEVLVSEDLGPAVIGIHRPQVVLPRWASTLPAAERAMLLCHECEHRDARDPAMLAVGIAFLITMPWNPAVWVMVRRLQLAIEVDCDRRVVGAGSHDLRRYAELLLTVGSRRVPALGMGFSVGRPFLEQRIETMTRPRQRHGRLYAAALVFGVCGVVAAGWSVPQPVRAMKIDDQVEVHCPDDVGKVSRRLLSTVGHST